MIGSPQSEARQKLTAIKVIERRNADCETAKNAFAKAKELAYRG
jgi:hypothetical protein